MLHVAIAARTALTRKERRHFHSTRWHLLYLPHHQAGLLLQALAVDFFLLLWTAAASPGNSH